MIVAPTAATTARPVSNTDRAAANTWSADARPPGPAASRRGGRHRPGERRLDLGPVRGRCPGRQRGADPEPVQRGAEGAEHGYAEGRAELVAGLRDRRRRTRPVRR